jgi:hypothetical protein
LIKGKLLLWKNKNGKKGTRKKGAKKDGCKKGEKSEKRDGYFLETI